MDCRAALVGGEAGDLLVEDQLWCSMSSSVRTFARWASRDTSADPAPAVVGLEGNSERAEGERRGASPHDHPRLTCDTPRRRCKRAEVSGPSGEALSAGETSLCTRLSA